MLTRATAPRRWAEFPPSSMEFDSGEISELKPLLL